MLFLLGLDLLLLLNDGLPICQPLPVVRSFYQSGSRFRV
jgi:hypothetical protein